MITSASAAVGANKASVHGSVNPAGYVTRAGFEWGTDPSSLDSYLYPYIDVGSGTAQVSIPYTITGLDPSTTYYYRATASNTNGLWKGKIRSFTTGAPAMPSVNTQQATSVDFYTATLNGLVNPNGLDTDAWFRWGTDPILATFQQSSSVSLGFSTFQKSMTLDLQSLLPSTTYYLQVIASNSEGTAAGEILSFTTMTFTSVITQPATSISATLATINGAVQMTGYPVTVRFDWGPDPTLSDFLWTETISFSASTSMEYFSYSLTELAGNQRYYFRARAEGKGYTHLGNTLNFSTQSMPASSFWARSYGLRVNKGYENAASIRRTADNGYIVSGQSYIHTLGSPSIIVVPWVMKLDPYGSVHWQKTYSIDWRAHPADVLLASDGSYITVGYTYTFPYSAPSRPFILWTNELGQVQWAKTYPMQSTQLLHTTVNAAEITTEDSAILVGSVIVQSGTTPINEDVLAFKVGTDGGILWGFALGGTGDDVANAVKDVGDGYLIAGHTTPAGAGSHNGLVMKIDKSGSIIWQMVVGGSGSDSFLAVEPTSDGGWAAAGYTSSWGEGFTDIWVVKFDADGNIQWQNTFGRGISGLESGFNIRELSAGGYMLSATAWLFAGNSPLFVLKLAADGTLIWQKFYSEQKSYSGSLIGTLSGLSLIHI